MLQIKSIVRIGKINRYELWETVKNLLFSQSVYHLALGMLGAALVMLLMHLFSPQGNMQISTVDVPKIINQFVKKQKEQNLTTQELQKRTYIFGKNLEASLAAISSEKQIVLLPREAVIAGGIDLTKEIQELMRVEKQ